MSRLKLRCSLVLSAALITTGMSATTPAIAQMTSAASADFTVRGPQATMQVAALTDSILRVRIAPGGTMAEDASWAVSHAMRSARARATPEANGFATAALNVSVDPQTLALTVTDKAGKVIVADAAAPLSLDGQSFTLRKAMPQAEHYYGLGDKTGGMDRRGGSFVDWNTDAFGFSSSTDPIYKSIPFFIGVGGAAGSYGVFLDNPRRAWFDFGHRDDGTLAFGSNGGPIDYYIIAGPSTAEVVRRYTDLTGKAPLAPQWALGYQQSRYSYMSADEVRGIADRLRSDRVPTDVIWLDIDYQDRNRPFTVNTKTFPSMKGLASDMDAKGIKLITIVDLHVANAPNQGYAPFGTGKAGDHFLHNPDGSMYTAPVWPGPSVFPDFTRSSTRQWWGGLFKEFLDDGIAGFWNDMNEPAIFDTPTKTMPLDTVHRIDTDDFAPRSANHSEIHNVYGMENTRATYEGLKTLRPNDRAFVMTRASYAGGQKYAVTWTGDNSSSWDHLKLSIQQIVNLGLSGFSYSAADVGGFTGGPSADLLTKWFEYAAFTPVFRDHAATGTPRAEPWVDGPAHLAIRRKFVEERYRLMPYLYGLAELNARTGDPITRPVFYDYPAASGFSCDQSMAFTLGGRLLIGGNPKPDSPMAYPVCLPAGAWYDYWTGMPVAGVKGKDPAFTTLEVKPTLADLPVYVRAGTILPRQPVTQSTAETPNGPLELHVYPGQDCGGDLYFDDGRTMGFQRGAYLRQHVSCSVKGGAVTVDFAPRQGQFAPWWREMAVVVHGRSGAGRATLDGKAVKGDWDATARTMTVVVPDQASKARLTVAAR
jgi:alpha-glucosidase